MGLGPCTINGTAYNPCSTVANTNQRRLFYLANPATGAAYGSVNTADDGAVARYNGVIFSVEHRLAHNFSFLTNYTNSYCISDADFGAALAADSNSQPFNRHADWGPCVFDTRHNFNTSLAATSSLKTAQPWVRRLLSDWQIAPLIHASSGQPLNVILGKDNSLTGLNPTNSNDRPNQLLANVSATNAVCSNGTTACVQWLNPSAFASNVPGAFGNLGRNSVRGPKTVNFDIAVSRLFRVTERYSVQARMDAFNVFNHTNFVGAISPAGTVTGYSTLSNSMTASTFGRVQSAFDPRILQFSMKVLF
jgi:hypothetical protein